LRNDCSSSRFDDVIVSADTELVMVSTACIGREVVSTTLGVVASPSWSDGRMSLSVGAPEDLPPAT